MSAQLLNYPQAKDRLFRGMVKNVKPDQSGIDDRSSSGGSSKIANGVRCNSSRFHSSSRRSLRFSALAARASTKFGNPIERQNAARRRPFHRFSDERAVSDVNSIPLRITAREVN